MKNKSICFFAAAAIIILAVLAILLCPWFDIKTKEVSGAEDISKQDIIKQAHLEAGNINIFAFNSRKAKKDLLKNPYIKDVKIKRKLPDTVIISVTQSQIRGYVPYLKSYLYIDDDGIVIDVKDSYTKPSPVVVGLDFNTFFLSIQYLLK